MSNNTCLSIRNQPPKKNKVSKGDVELLKTLSLHGPDACDAFRAEPLKVLFSLAESRRKVLSYLVDYSMHKRFVYPSQERIAEKTGLARSTVKLALSELKSLGLIDWIKRDYKENNLYLISRDVFQPVITKFLKYLIPCLAFFFVVTQLYSKPATILSSDAVRPLRINSLKEYKYNKSNGTIVATCARAREDSASLDLRKMDKNQTSFSQDLQQMSKQADIEQERRKKIHGKRIERAKVVDPSTSRTRSMLQRDILQPISEIVGSHVTISGLIQLSQFEKPIIKLALMKMPDDYYSCGYHKAYTYLYDECLHLSETHGLSLNKSRMKELKRYWHYKVFPQPTNEAPPRRERFLKGEEVKHKSPDYSGPFFERMRKQAERHEEEMRQKAEARKIKTCTPPENDEEIQAYLDAINEMIQRGPSNKKKRNEDDQEKPPQRTRFI